MDNETIQLFMVLAFFLIVFIVSVVGLYYKETNKPFANTYLVIYKGDPIMICYSPDDEKVIKHLDMYLNVDGCNPNYAKYVMLKTFVPYDLRDYSGE